MAKKKSKTSSKPQLCNLDEIKKALAVLKALNHKVRQDILNFIDTNSDKKVKDIYHKLRKGQGETSAQLAILRRAGVVTTKREGQVIHYSVNYKRLAEVEKGVKLINGKRGKN